MGAEEPSDSPPPVRAQTASLDSFYFTTFTAASEDSTGFCISLIISLGERRELFVCRKKSEAGGTSRESGV